MKSHMHRRLRRSRHGLTLLELMIVLIILVGLLALVGPRLLGSQKKADIKTAQAQISNLEQALKMYTVDMKTYPSTEEGLKCLLVAPEDERKAKNWDGPYVDGDSLPLDPWGNEFGYEFGGEGGSSMPRIYSVGPDGEEGTDDDIANRKKSEDGGNGEDGFDDLNSGNSKDSGSDNLFD